MTNVQIAQSEHYISWLDGLRDQQAVARIQVRVRRLTLGNPGDVKPVGRGVSEMRIDHGPGYRVYYLQRGTELVLLLCGGDKSTQAKDIAKAHEIAKEWH